VCAVRVRVCRVFVAWTAARERATKEGGGGRGGGGGEEEGREVSVTEAARITPNRGNMSIAALLQAAEYIERRERG